MPSRPHAPFAQPLFRHLAPALAGLALTGLALLAGSLAPRAHAQPQPPAPAASTTIDAPELPPIFAGFRVPPLDIPAPALTPSDWPERVPFAADSHRRGVAEVIEGPIARPRGTWLEGNDAGIDAQGHDMLALLLCAVPRDQPDLRDEVSQLQPRLTGRGVFLVYAPQPRERDLSTASTTIRVVSATRQGKRALLQTTWFSVEEPLAPVGQPAPKPRGLVLLMPGLLATPEGTLAALTRRLHQEGYVVVRMVAQPSRFLEQVAFAVDPANPAPAAEAIAGVFDDRGAECAFATREAFAHLLEKRPDLRGLPRAAIGFSGGAMTLPTVVAWEREAYSAAVMVGGGAHFLSMIQTSNYADWISAVAIRWTREPTAQERGDLETAYLRASRLDAYHTATRLRDLPTLLIDAEGDLAVPTPLATVLWERLGRPRRTTLPVGHEVLFMRLPTQFDAIAAFLNESLATPPAPR